MGTVTRQPQGYTGGTDRPVKKTPSTIRSARIEPADNGGFVMTIDHHNGDGMKNGYKKPETYAFKSAGQMHKHLRGLFPSGEMAAVAKVAGE